MDKEIKECNFAPQIIKSSETPRKLEKFLKDQDRFLKKITNISLPLSEERIDQRPTINKKSVEMVNKMKKDGLIYNRLYDMSKKPSKETESPSIKKDKITKKKSNTERRDLMLYQIAVNKKKEEIEKNKEEKKKTKSKPKEPTTDPILSKGFQKEFENALTKINLKSENESDPKDKLN